MRVKIKEYYAIKNCPNYYYEEHWLHPHRCNLTDGDWSCDVCMTDKDEYGWTCPLKLIYEKVKECQCSELLNGYYFDIEEVGEIKEEEE